MEKTLHKWTPHWVSGMDHQERIRNSFRGHLTSPTGNISITEQGNSNFEKRTNVQNPERPPLNAVPVFGYIQVG
jgi:hypothetical protein